MQLTLSDINQFRWIVPTALFIVLLLQLLYLAFLSRIPKLRELREPAPQFPPVQSYAPTQEYRAVQPMPTAPAPVMQQAAPPPPVQAAPVMPEQQPLASLRTATATTPAVAPQPRTGGVGKFIILAGVEGLSEMALPAKDFAIGRFYSPENEILVGLDEKSVSRKHARFTADEAIREYYLKDTSSSFGTFLLINGQFEQLTANTQERVYNEDVVRFGNVVTVRLLLPCETRGAVTSL
jgi:hypothetical protein